MESGQSFNDFVLGCARNFGALIEMRDDPMDAPIPEEFKPSDFHVKGLAESEKELLRLSKMTKAKQLAFGKAAKAKAVKEKTKWKTAHRLEDERLEAMEKQVLAWNPPSPDHTGIKDFMLDQIRISKNGTDFWSKRAEEEKAKSPEDFFTDALSQAVHNIQYHREHMAKEVENAQARTRWVKQLRASLTPVSANQQEKA